MSHVLVIQHSDLAHTYLPQTRQFFRLPENILDCFIRIPVAENFRLPENLVVELNEAHCDFAVLPDIKFSQVELIVSDMDSTLITIECIDEIAAQADLKNEVSKITEQAMRGELDFEQSLRNRVALLKGLPESVLQKVYDDSLKLTSGAQYLLEQCHEHKVSFVLVSGGFTFFTEKLKQRLGFEYAFANMLEIRDGILTGRILGKVIDAQAKADILDEFKQKTRGGYTIAVGDGANDIPMLKIADFGVAFHAKPKVQLATNLVINHNGLDALRHWFS